MDTKDSDDATSTSIQSISRNTETKHTQVFVLPPELLQGLLTNKIVSNSELSSSNNTTKVENVSPTIVTKNETPETHELKAISLQEINKLENSSIVINKIKENHTDESEKIEKVEESLLSKDTLISSNKHVETESVKTNVSIPESKKLHNDIHELSTKRIVSINEPANKVKNREIIHHDVVMHSTQKFIKTQSENCINDKINLNSNKLYTKTKSESSIDINNKISNKSNQPVNQIKGTTSSNDTENSFEIKKLNACNIIQKDNKIFDLEIEGKDKQVSKLEFCKNVEIPTCEINTSSTEKLNDESNRKDSILQKDKIDENYDEIVDDNEYEIYEEIEYILEEIIEIEDPLENSRHSNEIENLNTNNINHENKKDEMVKGVNFTESKENSQLQSERNLVERTSENSNANANKQNIESQTNDIIFQNNINTNVMSPLIPEELLEPKGETSYTNNIENTAEYHFQQVSGPRIIENVRLQNKYFFKENNKSPNKKVQITNLTEAQCIKEDIQSLKQIDTRYSNISKQNITINTKNPTTLEELNTLCDEMGRKKNKGVTRNKNKKSLPSKELHKLTDDEIICVETTEKNINRDEKSANIKKFKEKKEKNDNKYENQNSLTTDLDTIQSINVDSELLVLIDSKNSHKSEENIHFNFTKSPTLEELCDEVDEIISKENEEQKINYLIEKTAKNQNLSHEKNFCLEDYVKPQNQNIRKTTQNFKNKELLNSRLNQKVVLDVTKPSTSKELCGLTINKINYEENVEQKSYIQEESKKPINKINYEKNADHKIEIYNEKVANKKKLSEDKLIDKISTTSQENSFSVPNDNKFEDQMYTQFKSLNSKNKPLRQYKNKKIRAKKCMDSKHLDNYKDKESKNSTESKIDEKLNDVTINIKQNDKNEASNEIFLEISNQSSISVFENQIDVIENIPEYDFTIEHLKDYNKLESEKIIPTVKNKSKLLEVDKKVEDNNEYETNKKLINEINKEMKKSKNDSNKVKEKVRSKSAHSLISNNIEMYNIRTRSKSLHLNNNKNKDNKKTEKISDSVKLKKNKKTVKKIKNELDVGKKDILTSDSKSDNVKKIKIETIDMEISICEDSKITLAEEENKDINIHRNEDNGSECSDTIESENFYTMDFDSSENETDTQSVTENTSFVQTEHKVGFKGFSKVSVVNTRSHNQSLNSDLNEENHLSKILDVDSDKFFNKDKKIDLINFDKFKKHKRNLKIEKIDISSATVGTELTKNKVQNFQKVSGKTIKNTKDKKLGNSQKCSSKIMGVDSSNILYDEELKDVHIKNQHDNLSIPDLQNEAIHKNIIFQDSYKKLDSINKNCTEVNEQNFLNESDVQNEGKNSLLSSVYNNDFNEKSKSDILENLSLEISTSKKLNKIKAIKVFQGKKRGRPPKNPNPIHQIITESTDANTEKTSMVKEDNFEIKNDNHKEDKEDISKRKVETIFAEVATGDEIINVKKNIEVNRPSLENSNDTNVNEINQVISTDHSDKIIENLMSTKKRKKGKSKSVTKIEISEENTIKNIVTIKDNQEILKSNHTKKERKEKSTNITTKNKNSLEIEDLTKETSNSNNFPKKQKRRRKKDTSEPVINDESINTSLEINVNESITAGKDRSNYADEPVINDENINTSLAIHINSSIVAESQEKNHLEIGENLSSIDVPKKRRGRYRKVEKLEPTISNENSNTNINESITESKDYLNRPDESNINNENINTFSEINGNESIKASHEHLNRLDESVINNASINTFPEINFNEIVTEQKDNLDIGEPIKAISSSNDAPKKRTGRQRKKDISKPIINDVNIDTTLEINVSETILENKNHLKTDDSTKEFVSPNDVSKKRGRKRKKIDTLELGISNENFSSLETNVIDSNTENKDHLDIGVSTKEISSSVDVPKKRRGRRRKTDTVESIINSERINSIPETNVNELVTESKDCLDRSNQSVINNEHGDTSPNINANELITASKDHLDRLDASVINNEKINTLEINVNEPIKENKDHLDFACWKEISSIDVPKKRKRRSRIIDTLGPVINNENITTLETDINESVTESKDHLDLPSASVTNNKNIDNSLEIDVNKSITENKDHSDLPKESVINNEDPNNSFEINVNKSITENKDHLDIAVSTKEIISIDVPEKRKRSRIIDTLGPVINNENVTTSLETDINGSVTESKDRLDVPSESVISIENIDNSLEIDVNKSITENKDHSDLPKESVIHNEDPNNSLEIDVNKSITENNNQLDLPKESDINNENLNNSLEINVNESITENKDHLDIAVSTKEISSIDVPKKRKRSRIIDTLGPVNNNENIITSLETDINESLTESKDRLDVPSESVISIENIDNSLEIDVNKSITENKDHSDLPKESVIHNEGPNNSFEINVNKSITENKDHLDIAVSTKEISSIDVPKKRKRRSRIIDTLGPVINNENITTSLETDINESVTENEDHLDLPTESVTSNENIDNSLEINANELIATTKDHLHRLHKSEIEININESITESKDHLKHLDKPIINSENFNTPDINVNELITGSPEKDHLGIGDSTKEILSSIDVPKKRRGRPRKTDTLKQLTNNENNNTSFEISEPITGTQEEEILSADGMPMKRRGRRRKTDILESINKNESTNSFPETNVNESMSESKDQMEVDRPRKRRGRRPKTDSLEPLVNETKRKRRVSTLQIYKNKSNHSIINKNYLRDKNDVRKRLRVKSSNSVVIQKRKRGRPSKAELINNDIYNNEIDEVEEEKISSDESDVFENVEDSRKRRKRPFNAYVKRRKGRPRGRGCARKNHDDDYEPHHSQKLKRSKLQSEPIVHKTVTCGKCDNEMPKNQWAHHNLSVHNDLGWLKDAIKPDFENDDKLVKRILFNAIKKRRGYLTCEICKEIKHSVLGFLSHVAFCGKTEEEARALLVLCTVCQKLMKPCSLEYHERIHRKEAEQKVQIIINETEQENENSGLKLKRKAAEKAVTKISECTSTIKEEPCCIPLKKLIKKPQLVKRISSLMIHWWNRDLNAGKTISCQQPGCDFKSNSLDEIKQHWVSCNFTPQENFICKICRFQSLSEDEVVKHAYEKHSVEDSDDANLSISEAESSSSGNNSDVEVDEKNENSVKKFVCRENFTPSYKVFKFLPQNCGYPTRFIKTYLPAFQWTLELEQKNYGFNLFKEFMPTDFKLLSKEESFEYLPELDESMLVKSEKTSNSTDPKWKKWKRFEGGQIQNYPAFFVGGPVWALAWLTIPTYLTFSENIEQYIAVSTHPTMESEYSFGKAYPGKNIIQIWNVGELDHRTNSKTNPKLAYAIAHDGGTVWSLEWCPSGCYQHKDLPDCVEENNEVKRMGLLAAGCSDGCIRVYSLNFPSDLLLNTKSSQNDTTENMESSKNTENSECNYPVYNMEPVLKLVTHRNYEPSACQVTKLSWSKGNNHNVIAAGFSNGTVGLWDLSSKSPFLSFKKDSTVFLCPYRYFLAHHHAVTMVQIVPLGNDRFLATGSLDRYYKFWDLEDIIRPKNSFKKSFVTDGSWMSHWNCALISYDDAVSMNHNYIYCVPVREYTYKNYNILPTNSPSFTISTSDFGNSIASATLGGEVLAIFPQQLLYEGYMTRTLPRKRFVSVVSSIKVVDFEATKNTKSSNNTEEQNNKPDYNFMPSTYNESKDRFGLEFHDEMGRFRDEYAPRSSSRKNKYKRNLKKTLTHEMMASVPVEQYPFMSANRVTWNPNAWSFLWLAVGYQNGFVRLFSFKSLASTNEWNIKLKAHIDDLNSRITTDSNS